VQGTSTSKKLQPKRRLTTIDESQDESLSENGQTPTKDSSRSAWQNHEEPCPPTAIRGQCRTPPRAQQDEAPLALWNGVDCSSLLMSRSRRIPRRSCRTIPRGDKLDGLLGTKTCLCCTTAPATVRWESLLATQGQLPACSRQLRSPAPATVRWGGDVLWCVPM